MASKNSTIDITKTGPQGFRTLQDLNSLESPNIRPEIRDFITKSRSERNSYTLYNPYEQAPADFETSFARTSTPWGSSRFDNKTATEEEFRNLGDVRANNQPWYAKIGAGLAKGVILTGTTFLDGTVGLLVGAGTAMEEGRWSALWDNDFSKAMQAVNEKSEEWLPNYYTEKEQTSPWYENIFTANFLGDKFIKNLGFTVGAFYSGNVAANTIGLARRGLMAGAKGLGASISTVKNIGNVSSHVASAVGAVTSAVNEGRIEALNNSKDWFELQKMQIDDRHNQMLAAIDAQYKGTEIYDSLVTAENNNYEATIGKLTEDRLKMGNADLLMNIPILTASNIIQFGKLYANGFKTAKRASNIVGRPGAYKTTMTTSRGLIKGITNSLSEGVEEISQKAASVSSGLYHESDVNNFYKAKMDPETEQEQLDWMKALAKGINETVNEGSSWEEFFIGTLTGALGMPSFGRTNTKNAYIGKNKSIGLSGGIIGEVVEYRERMAREQEIVDYMNSRVQSPEFLNYYQGLTRHNKYQKDMNKAVLENDEFDYKNSEYNQFVSDIIMFDNAGKIEDLKTLIGSAYDISDENLESIIRNTTSVTAEGKLVGPYAQYATRDSDGNIVANFGDEEGKREMANKLTESKNDMLKTIQDYIDAKTEIDLSVGDRIDDEQLKELTWLKIATQNLRDRGSEIFESAKMSLNKALGHATKRRDYFRRAKEAHANDSVEEGGKKRFNISEEYRRFEKDEKTEQSNIDFIADLLNSDPEIVGMYLAMNPKTLENIKEAIKNTPEVSPTEAADFNKKIDDLIKIDKLSRAYNEKLEEYLKNPEKQQEDKAKAREEVAKSSKELSQSAIVSRFNWNASIPEIARTLEENRADIDSTGGIEEFRKLLTPAQKRKITQANKFNSTVKGLKNRIDGSDLTDQQKRIANSLIDQAASESENIKDIANSISNNLDSNVEEAIKRELSKPGMGVNGSDIEAIIEETAAKLKDFFDDIISKVAQSISEAERVREKKEKADAKKIKKAADDLSSKEKASGPSAEAAPQEEKKLDPTQDDAPKNERTINPTLPGDLTSRKFEPKKASNIEQGTGKNEYTFRPQISEVYMHGYNMQTYLQYIEETPEAIPEGVDPEAFKTYIREVHKYLKDKGAFAFVNGTDSTWKLEVGDKLSFEYDKELSDLAGVDVVTIVVEKDGKKQLVGTLPTSLDFDSKSRYSVTKEDGTVEWKTSNETTGEKRPAQKALYDYVLANKDGNSVISTKVDSLRGGMVSFSDTQRSVSDIYGDTVPIIAVMDTTPRLTTGNDAMDAKFIDANNAVPWQVYTMVPANNGSYLPALCISTPLEGLGKDDWYMQQMVEAFKNILTSTTDRKDRILEFYKWLNIPGLSVGIGTYEGHNKFVKKDITEATHVRITYSDPVNKDDVRQISINITRESLSDDAVFTALQNVISDYNQRAKKAGIHEITTNVDIKKLTNRPDHLEYRRNIAKYLSTNISEGPHTVNDWFTYEPTLIETEVVRAENAKKEEPGAAKPHIHNAAKVVTLNGVQYTKDEDGRIFNEKGEEVTIQLGEDILAEIGNSGRVEVTPPSQPELPKSAIDISAFGFTKPSISAAPTGRGSRRRPTRSGKNMDITEALDAEPKATKSSIEDDVRMIQKLFPSLSESGRVIVVNGLRVISEKGNAVEIYGHFRDGILYINSNSPRGTAFHEAFHYITEALMSESELGMMFNEAANRYGRMANIALEERLAEDFRDFMNGFNDTSIMGRIKSMFRNLKYIIKQITGNINYLDNLFFNIYKGNYSNRREVLTDNFAVSLLRYKNSKLAYEYLSEDIQTGLAARGISKEDYNNLTVHDKENTIHCLI